MKNEIKTIIIGITITLLVIFLALFILYKIDQKQDKDVKPTNENTTTSITNEENNIKPNEKPTISNENNLNNNDKETENKAIIYLFHGSKCPACQNALEIINQKKETTYKDIDIKFLEVQGNADNSALLQKVIQKFNVEKAGIPFFVIGDVVQIGYNEEKILNEFKKANSNKNYKDVVNELIKANPDLNPIITE